MIFEIGIEGGVLLVDMDRVEPDEHRDGGVAPLDLARGHHPGVLLPGVRLEARALPLLQRDNLGG